MSWRYFQSVETIVWTPGLAAGNPLQLAPLPDLAAVTDDPDELQAAVSMVVATLGPVVAPGQAMKAKHKRGVLSNALKYFAQQGGGSLQQLKELLSDLPPLADPVDGLKWMTDTARLAPESVDFAAKRGPVATDVTDRRRSHGHAARE